MTLIQHLKYHTSSEIIGNVSNNLQHFTPYVLSVWQTKTCPYCGTALKGTENVVEGGVYIDDTIFYRDECDACGWWRRNEVPAKYFSGYCHVAILYRCNLDQHKYLKEGLAELSRSIDRIYGWDPTRFEVFVGDVFRAFLNCEVVHTGRTNDEGIDLVILDSNSGVIPVQVKRRSLPAATESVSVVREFRGAMLLQGAKKGKIVSTAHHFSKQAKDISLPKPEHLAPQEIDLIDARRLLDILGVIDASSK